MRTLRRLDGWCVQVRCAVKSWTCPPESAESNTPTRNRMRELIEGPSDQELRVCDSICVLHRELLCSRRDAGLTEWSTDETERLTGVSIKPISIVCRYRDGRALPWQLFVDDTSTIGVLDGLSDEHATFAEACLSLELKCRVSRWHLSLLCEST